MDAVEAAISTDALLASGCVLVLLQWPAGDGLPAQASDVMVEALPTVEGDTARLEIPHEMVRANGTALRGRLRLALHRRTGRGVASLLLPDGAVARQGEATRARRCP
jgi:hypothetical protein